LENSVIPNSVIPNSVIPNSVIRTASSEQNRLTPRIAYKRL
jgi:hypothetical protein